jgi:hypothetical protein
VVSGDFTVVPPAVLAFLFGPWLQLGPGKYHVKCIKFLVLFTAAMKLCSIICRSLPKS